MISGLNGEEKMSKSDPDSSIFMDDSEEDIRRKIGKALVQLDKLLKIPF